MKKEDILSKVGTLNLPKGSYVIFGSCPLTIADIRESNDIDLLVSEEVHKRLAETGWQKVDKGSNDKPLVFDVFEAHNNWNFSSYNPTLEDLLSRATEVDNVLFASIKDVKKWKVASGRPKDLDDIVLIDKYLETLK